MTQEVVTLLAQEDWPMDQLQTRLDALEQQMSTVNCRLRWWRGLAGGLLGLAVLTWALPSGLAQEEDAKKGPKGLAQRVAALEDLLKHFSREKNEIFLTGANLHLVNGLGSTDCFNEQGEVIPDCPNGLGNLIVGYNELRDLSNCNPSDDPFCNNTRTGSHNVVVGQQHNFSRFGGLVVGLAHTISGDFAVVSGGNFNTASGDSASVSGGQNNTASGPLSSVSGGQNNTASGGQTWVSGGFGNLASGFFNAAASGGFGNTASANFSSVSGGGHDFNTGEGAGNTASGDFSSVSGGSGNTASGRFSSVSGGQNITQETDFGWSAGSEAEEVVVGNVRSP
jgi:hypothetical protein